MATGRWNFHGHIAVPLEWKAKDSGIEATADDIESGRFVEVMVKILKNKLGDNPKTSEFVEKSKQYVGVSANNISPEDAKSLYTDFMKLADYKQLPKPSRVFLIIGIVTFGLAILLEVIMSSTIFAHVFAIITVVMFILSAVLERNKHKIKKAIGFSILAYAIVIGVILLHGFTFQEQVWRLQDYARYKKQGAEIGFEVASGFDFDEQWIQDIVKDSHAKDYITHEMVIDRLGDMKKEYYSKDATSQDKKELEKELEIYRGEYCPALPYEILDIVFSW